jgi:hypothetical protein
MTRLTRLSKPNRLRHKGGNTPNGIRTSLLISAFSGLGQYPAEDHPVTLAYLATRLEAASEHREREAARPYGG